jgi:hypothetical protein
MVHPRRRGSRLLHLPGISVDPRARALAATLVVTPPAHSEVRPVLFLVIMLRRHHLSVSYVRHPVARPFLSPTCESLHCASFIYSPPSHVTRIVCRASFIYLFPMFVILSLALARPLLSPTRTSSVLRVPFYLLLVSHCVARPLSVCLARTSVLLYTAGAEGRIGYQTRWRAGRIKGWMW